MPFRKKLIGIIMSESIFNPTNQEKNLSSKIVVGLERISEAFKVLLWEKAKTLGLSPIQIQILIFISCHKSDLCNVSHLSKEFNVTKATVSDAIKVLEKKELVIKDFSPSDGRSYSILLSESGKKKVTETENFALPISKELQKIEAPDLHSLFETLSKLIYQLNRNQILSIQRICFGCQYHGLVANKDYCNLLEKELIKSEIRLDCPEFKLK